METPSRRLDHLGVTQTRRDFNIMSEAKILKPGSLAYAASKIGCSIPTLYKLIGAGKLRSYHIGKAHRVSEQAILDCICLLERERPCTISREHAHYSAG